MKQIPKIDILYIPDIQEKKKQENDGVGDISSLFQRHCQTWNKDEISSTPSFSCFFLEYQEYKMSIFVLFCTSLSCLLVVVSREELHCILPQACRKL